MATSTLIQYLNPTQNTISGGTTPVGASTSDRSQTETFLTNGVITAGDWVAFDTTQTGASRVLFVDQAAAVALGNGLVCGVALESVDGSLSTKPIKVVISGYAEALTTGAVAGNPLAVVATLATAQVNVAANIASACGVALEASAVGPLLTAVWVYKQF